MLMTELLRENPESRPRNHPAASQRQHLPLHRVSEHHRGGRARGRADAREDGGCVMAEAGKMRRRPAGRQRERPDQTLKSSARACCARRIRASSSAAAASSTTSTLPNMAARGGAAQPARARPHQVDRQARGSGAPGVVAVITGDEVAQETGPLPCFANPPVEQRCIALGKVRHVGEPVVLVVADSRYIAEDAIALIKVEYEAAAGDLRHDGGDQFARRCGAASRARARQRRRASRISRSGRSRRIRRRRSCDQAPACAGRVPARQPIETCGAVASFDERRSKFTIHVNSLDVQLHRLHHRAALKVAEPSRSILCRSIAGGSFGSKLFLHKVCVLAASAARICRPPGQVHRGPDRQHHRPATITARIAPTTSSLRSTPTTG